MFKRLTVFVAVLQMCAVVYGAPNDSSNDAQNDSDPPVPAGAKVVARWSFDEPATPAKAQDLPSFDEPGPRPPLYPDFPSQNQAALFSGSAQIVVSDDDSNPGLRFTQGDSLTLEAWVRVQELKPGAYAYLLGKGRSGKKGFAEKNQNYALRLKGDAHGARISFLFASQGEANKPGAWHRWTSTEGFVPGPEWHHVAVTYTFGKPDQLRGYVDGREVPGEWDMEGATTRPPVNDADDLTIGSGNGGGANNRFQGWLDNVAIYRGILSPQALEERFTFVPPPPPVDKKTLVADQVLVQLCEEGLPNHNGWPLQAPQATETYLEPAFGFFELPQKYIDTGVRGDRNNPLLMRAAALVTLPAGKHRLLLRSRSASRLFIDGKQALDVAFPPGDAGGHGHVKQAADYLNLGPDFRFAPAGEQEAWKAWDFDGGEHFVLFETLVGGILGKSHRRPELGETVVAVSLEGSTSWRLLTPSAIDIPYNDAGWARYASERRLALDERNAAARAAQCSQHARYWDRRRQAARDWLAHSPDVPVPQPQPGYPAYNAIDHFLNARLAEVADRTAAQPAGGVDYFRDVAPILESRCLGCHRGNKPQGALRLDSLADAQRGGESYGPAIVPGKPGESSLLARVRSTDPDEVMPPKGERLSDEQIATIERWIGEGAGWPEFRAGRLQPTPLVDDLTFLRRVTLDTVGLIPTEAELDAFLSAPADVRRAQAIDRLLDDPRRADHWMGYWQDVLAENPNILNPTLNNTGPFRWWIYESLQDDKPMDLFVTELVRMRGSIRFGGPAGFGVASQNDAPFAAKGTILSTAFLGVEMKCARCHDAPAHDSTQRELFQLAAMLATKPVEVPKSSSVALDKLGAGGRTPLIRVTLQPGTNVDPQWPFAEFVDESLGRQLAEQPDDPRDRLAALITAPQNERFAQVAVNRVWKRLMGRGLVDPVDDWERGKPTHPELLRWLAREFVRQGYQIKPIERLILNSHAYQRTTDPDLREPGPLYAAPAPRRLGAEQIVDSMFVATGKPFQVEEVSLDVDGRRDLQNSITLGRPHRSWMLASTSNERDRPSLALPRVQAVTDVLQAFGWRGARQDPTSVRETAANALQPAIVANGVMSVWLTRLSDDHGITQAALEQQSLDELLDRVFLRVLTRHPTADERSRYAEYLRPGYDTRVVEPVRAPTAAPRQPRLYVSWSNHLDPESTILRQQEEAAARRGDPPTTRLAAEWRDRLEDVLWALLNAPEFTFTP